MDIKLIKSSDINLNIEAYSNILNPPLRYYGFKNPGIIIERDNEYLYFEEMGSQYNGFKGINAELYLVHGTNGYFYQMDVYADTRGDFKRIIKRFAPYEFNKAFAEFKDTISKFKGTQEFYKIEINYMGINQGPENSYPKYQALIEFDAYKKIWAECSEAVVSMIKV